MDWQRMSLIRLCKKSPIIIPRYLIYFSVSATSRPKMRRVTSLLPSWENYSKADSKRIFDRPWVWLDAKSPSVLSHHHHSVSASELRMLSEPVIPPMNILSQKIDCKEFWPTNLHKESDRAARILRSFCKDGFYPDPDWVPKYSTDVPRPLMVIPQRVIQEAVGLAIFTATRAGIWVSGAGGSGVLIARKADGRWSPPAGILLQTSTLSFSGGVDIYDCVIVINDHKALNTFHDIRTTLGREIITTTGPLTEAGVSEFDSECINANTTAFTYLKSRGFQANLSMDGTTIIGRNEENRRSYGRRIGMADILAGKVQLMSYEGKLLLETVKAVEGCDDVNQEVLDQAPDQQSPGDTNIYPSRTSSFGIPEAEDPDPFGVVALERAGLEIRESGTRSRPPSTQFEFHPSPTSPLFARYNRRSIDTIATGSNRGSYVSTRTRNSTERYIQTMDMATQTDEPLTPDTSPSYSDFKSTLDEESSTVFKEINYTKTNTGSALSLENDRNNDIATGTSERHLSVNTIDGRPNPLEPVEPKSLDEDVQDNFEFEEEDEDPVIFEAASAQAAILQSTKRVAAGLVNIPKRGPPPPVPARNASRGTIDPSTLEALRLQIESIDLRRLDRRSFDKKSYNSPRLINPITMNTLPDLQESLEEKAPTTELPSSSSRI
ncbi:putative duf500 domain-containing protein [Golovinomyces cichoracearum]|uniref:Putative duf500 domain-containing protein n=1 Tax=Golovinomyces cichoracearum TaxID=62708 RepID=A0A420HAQ5_9PEZI|nr:putative duf500 domain-containing protein [Golovinomyces cichoracearum]